jgi:quinol monooxygenase YgiN
MILRILRGRTAEQDLEPLLDAVQADMDDWAAIGAGLLTAQPAYRLQDDALEFLLVSTWTDAEAVLAQGGDVTQPRGRLGASGLLGDGRAGHYELIMSEAREDARPLEVVRLSSIPLVPRRASAFYEELRQVWDALVEDAGLVALHVGRRVEPAVEQAVVVSVWESSAALAAATAGGFIGGSDMSSFYAGEPAIEHFTALSLEGRGSGRE